MTARPASAQDAQVWSLVANISLLFAELPLLERIPAAKAAGFDAVEAWWPFPGPRYDDAVEQFLQTLEDHRMQLTGLNFFAGDMPGGERGIVSQPDRREEFTDNVDAIVRIARQTNARGFNALYGQRQPGVDPAEQDRVGLENLVHATRAVAEVDGTVLLEPLSRGLNGAYPLETAAQAVGIIERVRTITGTDNIGLLFDTFHLANNGEELVSVINRFGSLIAHVQLADAPGRGAPGSGAVDFDGVLAALADAGYEHLIACEYVPGGDTRASLQWIAETPYVQLG